MPGMLFPRRATLPLLTLLTLPVALLALAGPGAAQDATLADRAAQVLAQRCLSCHSAEKKSGGVDLSTRAAAASAGITQPDDPAKNRLVRMVAQGKMPPTGRLPAGETAVLRAWVRAGTPYPAEKLEPLRIADQPLWSLQPLRRPTVPKSAFDVLARNPIDRFMFAKLAAKGLRPSPPADRRALLRRVTLDLTGLPPTPEEIDTFVNDRSPDAYGKVVDRLLASPAYGECWGQHWLDVVRYGESNGYEQNHLRGNAWPYRDYVIRSLNEDKPYDRFVAEQLAGDVVGKGDPKVEVATGFLVAGIHDTVGNATEEGTRQQRANDLDDMVAATGETFLGLSVGCAKCHDHKFDPIPQRDYYRLAACFGGVRHGERPLTPQQPRAGDAQAEQRARELRRLVAALSDLDAEARSAVLRAQGVAPVPRPALNPRRNVERFAPAMARFVRLTIEATKDGTQPCLDEVEVYAPGAEENLALASRGAKASASSLLPGYAIHQVEHLNDGRWGNDWSWISSEPGKGWAQIELPQPAEIDRVVWSRDSALQPRFSDRVPSLYRVEISADGRAWMQVASSADRAAAPEAIPAEKLRDALTEEHRDRRARLSREADALRQQAAQAAGAATAYIGLFTTPDPVYLLKRGDVMQRAEEVQPGALSRVAGLPPELGALVPEMGGSSDAGLPEPARRLALARWITDARNPLTSRVIVNRVWHYHFGRGIVGTPSDFGHNGEKPTHPELLDWLAGGFAGRWALGVGPWAEEVPSQRLTPNAQRPAWSLKALHRLIVTSYTYQQSSLPNPKGVAVDAGNQLLWRMPLRRMDAETIRDAILATSGKLDKTMGGPGFQLYKYRVVNVAIYEPRDEWGPETWRRGVYRQAARAIRDDLLGSFDCPESAQRTPRRPTTTTPLQALSLLNGPFSVQQAGFFAERVRREVGDAAAAQVRRAFPLAFGRIPTPEEQRAAEALVAAEGLATLCRALLNANEFLYY